MVITMLRRVSLIIVSTITDSCWAYCVGVLYCNMATSIGGSLGQLFVERSAVDASRTVFTSICNEYVIVDKKTVR